MPEVLNGRVFAHDNMTSQRPAGDGDVRQYEFEGRVFRPGAGTIKTDLAGLDRLAAARRLMVIGGSLRYVRYLNDFPLFPLNNQWHDTSLSGFAAAKLYVVQTLPKVIERCILMTTGPGDLVLDPTCGSGTTAYVAEQWGRRWITIDTSRVPLALARQRLLTATFPYYELKDETLGPAGGLVYKRRQNSKGEEVGGIVPHITLKGIANDEPPGEEVLVDRPEEARGTTRVAGPFCVEATIPTPLDWGDDAGAEPETEQYASFLDRMLDVLRRAPVLQVGQGRSVTLKNTRPPAKSLALSAEAVVENGTETPVALVFGTENGAINERLVYDAAREAHAKAYAHLYVFGFAIRRHSGNLCQCNTRSDDGRPIEDDAVEPDFLGLRIARNRREEACG